MNVGAQVFLAKKYECHNFADPNRKRTASDVTVFRFHSTLADHSHFFFFFCLTLDPKPINSYDFTSQNHNSAYLVDLCINGIHFIQFADEIDFSQTEKPICLQRNFYVCNSQFKCYSLSVRHQSYSLLSFCFCCKFFFRIFRFFYFLTFNGNNRFPANPFDVYFRIQILPNCKIWAK